MFGIPKGIPYIHAMIKFEHSYMAPHLFVLRDQKYIIPGWIPVPMETEIKDIEWVRPLTTKVQEPNLWSFKSDSNPDITYHVRKTGTQYKCTCPGFFKGKGKCKHTKQVIENEGK